MGIPRWAKFATSAAATILAVSLVGPAAHAQSTTGDPQAVKLALARQQTLTDQLEILTLTETRMVSLNEMHADVVHNSPSSKDPKALARQMMNSRYGWGDTQFECYNNVIIRESGWDPLADNPNSSAYGIPQALPGKRMAQFGSDWRTNPVTQITWGLWYVKTSYGTPCNAWSFKKAHGWY